MTAYAYDLVGKQGRRRDWRNARKLERLEVLVSVGAAIAVNCPTSLASLLDPAERHRISPEEIAEITALAGRIRERAISHVERVALRKEANAASTKLRART